MSRKHMVGSVDRCHQQNEVFSMWGLPNDSKHNEASFSTILTDMLYLCTYQCTAPGTAPRGRMGDLTYYYMKSIASPLEQILESMPPS